MKIDLHVHTLKCKKGDSEKRNVSLALFKQKVIEAGVSVLGITNHNCFDLEQYKLFRNTLKDECDIWPGVEFDVKQIDTKAGHVIVIVNPRYADRFSDTIKSIVGSTSLDDYCISVDDLTSIFNSFDPVFIAHYFKPKSLGNQDMEKLEQKVYRKSRLIKEPSSVVSIGVLNSYDQKCLLGSDVRDWNEYEKGTFSELKYDFEGYDNFLKLLDKDTSYVNDLLSKTHLNKITVYGVSETKKYPYTIDAYNDVNVIFGDRGSGKSEIIKSLDGYYKSNSTKALKYKGGEKDSWFDSLLKVDINDYSYVDMGLENDLSDVFSNINDFVDALPVPISEYRKYCEHKTNNTNSAIIKIKEMPMVNSYSLDEVDRLYNQYIKIDSFIKFFVETDIYKNNRDKYSSLLSELNNASSDSFELYRKKWIEAYSIKLLDNAIETINTAVSECVGNPPVPTKTGFYDFAANRLSLKSSVHSINRYLNLDSRELSNAFIGNVGDKGNGKISEVIQYVNKANCEIISAKWQNGRKTKYNEFFNKLSLVESSIYDSSLSGNIVELKRVMKENNIQDIDFFLCVSKTFTLNNEPYIPSKGEICILSMQHEFLSKINDYSVFLLDEPESGLGNDYIEKNIVPLIKNIAKSGKTVFVATHNANIAVRTLPATSILKTVDNNVFSTFQGSMFTNSLININNPLDTRDWNIESENHLEGGEKAFKERGYYYAEID